MGISLAQDNGTDQTRRSANMKHAAISILLSIAASLGGTLLLRALLSATAGPLEPLGGDGRPPAQNINPVVVFIPIVIGNGFNPGHRCGRRSR
jgi:hypothetical protein